jgi:light-regulated signal transduction histidine kinase (bacteriophytochrome)
MRSAREALLRKELEAAEARAERDIAQARARMVDELESKNKELEAFSYSVSHDLRAPLRSIDGFSRALLEDYADKLDATGTRHLTRVRAAAQRMGELIDDLLNLSRVGRAQLRRARVDLSDLAQHVMLQLAQRHPERVVETEVHPDLHASADAQLLRVALENLLGNAWKFTARAPQPRVVFGADVQDGAVVYYVRDNGAGFDMTYAAKLFTPFQRLHSEAEFPGTGIGLATVRRIVDRHGGRVWAEGQTGVGATIRFTVPGSGGPEGA